MDYISTNFGVDSSSRFPLRAQTVTHTDKKQTQLQRLLTDHRIHLGYPRLGQHVESRDSHQSVRSADDQWHNFGLKSGEGKLEAPKASMGLKIGRETSLPAD